jgi:dTMP kinase
MSGLLIAFEGLDQSGKQTQALRLREWLETQGHRVETLEFPSYDTPIAQEIELALGGERHYPPDVLQLLFIANRYEYGPRIERWLSEGAVVLCDRYLASSVAYGEAQGLDPGWLSDVQCHLPQPDLTILLDIGPDVSVRRKALERDRLEHDRALQERARASYLRQAQQPAWRRIDGERHPDEVASEVLIAVRSRLAQP